MRHYLLHENYMIDIVQLGFGFRNLIARKRWVTTLENLLYNFNIQCKFMMPCKHEPPALKALASFSNYRAAFNDTYMAYNTVFSPESTQMKG